LSQFEVDFVVELPGGPVIAIEVKGTSHVPARDLKGLRAFGEDAKRAVRYLVCEEPAARDTEDGIRIRPVGAFLEELWQEGLARLART
jgi:hypothetical protein